MSLNLVPCPNGGKCGARMHNPDSDAYRRCTVALDNGRAASMEFRPGGAGSAVSAIASSTSAVTEEVRAEAVQMEDITERIANLLDCDGIEMTHTEVTAEETLNGDWWTPRHRHYKVTFTNEEGQTLDAVFHTAGDIRPEDVMEALISDGSAGRDYDSVEEFAEEFGHDLDAEMESAWDDIKEEDQSPAWKRWKELYDAADQGVDEVRERVEAAEEAVSYSDEEYSEAVEKFGEDSEEAKIADTERERLVGAHAQLEGELEEAEELRDNIMEDEPERILDTPTNRLFNFCKDIDRELDALLGDKRDDYEYGPDQ